MKKLFLAASGLALAATGAFAASESDNVVINAVISEYIDLNVVDNTQTYNLSGLSNLDVAGSQSEDDKAKIVVTSNTAWTYEVTIPTWTPPNDGSGWDQAKFTGADTGKSIGGSIHVDHDLGFSSGNQGLCRMENNGGVVKSANNGGSKCNGSTPTVAGVTPLWIGAQISQNLTDGDGGIAPPDTYSATATVMVATAP